MEDVLRIGGVGVDVLAATYGTPLYIYDQHVIEERMEDYRRYFRSDVLHCEVLYASKAFCIQEMMRLAKRHDLSLDVVSGGELYTALAAGVDQNASTSWKQQIAPGDRRSAAGRGRYADRRQCHGRRMPSVRRCRSDRRSACAASVNPGVTAQRTNTS